MPHSRGSSPKRPTIPSREIVAMYGYSKEMLGLIANCRMALSEAVSVAVEGKALARLTPQNMRASEILECLKVAERQVIAAGHVAGFVANEAGMDDLDNPMSIEVPT